MGEAVLRAAIRAEVFPERDIIIVERSAAGRDHLSTVTSASICSSTESRNLLTDEDLVVLCVKPQDFSESAAESLSAMFDGSPLILSVMAGISLERISSLLGGDRKVIRSMPNIAARVGASLTTFIRGKNVSAEDAQRGIALLKSLGRVVEVDDERLIDAGTAIAGSGPAYFYFVVEHLVSAGVELGFDQETAKKIALETFIGAARLAVESGKDALELRSAVTSKGGTTEAAFAYLVSQGVDKSFHQAVIQAYEKARKLGLS